MKNRIIKRILLMGVVLLSFIGSANYNYRYADLVEYKKYVNAYEQDITGENRGITYPEWWGDEIDRKFLALYISPELTPEEAVLYAQEIDRWAPGHGGDIIINAVYAQGYGLETVDAMKQAGYLPADYVHPAAAGQTQQPVVDAPATTEVQPQPEQQPTVAESTPQPVQQPVVEEPTIEETVESETVVETTESEETVVESTEESVETETTTETAEESSESYETVVEENRGFPVIPVLIGVLIAGLCGAGLYFWKKQKQN